MKIGRHMTEEAGPHGGRFVKGYNGAHLGTLEWHAEWRCWEFVPAPHVGLTSQCLRDLAEHVSRQAPLQLGASR